MPKIQTTKVYYELENAIKSGYTTVSEQGSSRSGKTFNTVIWLCVYLMNHPNLRLSVVRKTLPALRGSVMLDFKEVLSKIGVWDWKSKAFNKSDFTFTFPNGSWIEFFSTDDEQKLRGRKRDICYVNEANELSQLEWQQLKMRTTKFTIADYNPSFTEEHWLCQINADPRTYHFITTYKDNPFLEQTIVDEIESLRKKNHSLWRIYGLGLQAVIEGLVFPNCDLVDVIPSAALKHRYRGCDFGYENDSTAIEDVYFDGKDVYIDELCYNTHMLTSDIIKVFKENDPTVPCVSESADPRLVQEIYRAGVNIHPVVKFPGSVQAGIQTMQSYRFHFTKRSINAWKEAKNYTWAQDKEGKWLNVPVDAFNHCFVADTQIETSVGKKRICDIMPGELVMTSKGYRKVIYNHNNGYKKVLRFSLNFGKFKKELVCTPDHKVKTKEGWKQIQDLRTGDVLFVSQSTLNAKIGSSLMEKSSSCIMERDTTQKEEGGCTLLCGNTITDRFQKVMKSIIRILTAPITKYPILSASQEKSIKKNIGSATSREEGAGNLWSILRELGKRQVRGTEAKKDVNGILNMENESLLSSSQNNSIANAVEKSFYQKKETQNSAQIIASLNGEYSKDLITKQEFANGAGKNLSQIATQESHIVVEVALLDIVAKPLESEQEVYDLTIDHIHEYIANGIVVHNCWDGIRYVFLMKVMGGRPRPVDLTKLASLAGR